MEGRLKAGTTLTSNSGTTYKVIRFLDSGGQGEVYEVEGGGRRYALKWYFPAMATDLQKTILKNLILRGSPDRSFLWPLDMASMPGGKNELFGYIMELRPGNYRSIRDLMKRSADPTFFVLCRAAFNLVKGYKTLHDEGYCYRDISFGNLFFDPETGDVLICDNDNVTYNGAEYSAVTGTPRFMAPEIVRGESVPSRNTDQWSLAVLLFYIFMLNHPLEGKHEADIRCLDLAAMNYLYGTDPVFIYDPDDTSNRPVEGYQDNALIYWGLYPQELRDLFTYSFTAGISHPQSRVTEGQWLDALANMMSGIITCPKCGAEIFYDPVKRYAGEAHRCWNCHSRADIPLHIRIERSIIPISVGARLYSHHIRADYDMETVKGVVVENPRNPRVKGIMNMDDMNWTYIRADGTHAAVASEKSAAVKAGAMIDFGSARGVFE